MWLLLIAELTVSVTFIGLMYRAMHRYDRHLTRIEAELGRDRDAVIANVRTQVNAALAELKEQPTAAIVIESVVIGEPVAQVTVTAGPIKDSIPTKL